MLWRNLKLVCTINFQFPIVLLLSLAKAFKDLIIDPKQIFVFLHIEVQEINYFIN